MTGSYFINHKAYSLPQLLTYASELLNHEDATDWEKDLGGFILDWFSSGEYVSIRTSGSTGIPKEIRLSKIKMLHSAERSLAFFDIKPGENALLCLPVKYIAGMLMVVRAFAGELNLITRSPQQIQLDSIAGTIHFTAMVPLQVEKLINEKQDLDKINKLIIGGAALSFGLAKKIKSAFKGGVWETYGMTETITHVAVKKINEGSGALFQALPGISFSTDYRGCLVISDPLLQEQSILTNDNVTLFSPTSFRLLGRYDNIINSGGIKVQPEELERILSSHVKMNFCISSVPDDRLGQLIVLVVEKGADVDLINKAILQIEAYRRPKKIIELEIFPISSNGKPDLRKVKELIGKINE
jgi:o-succinylbenzoate---CoA ligase